MASSNNQFKFLTLVFILFTGCETLTLSEIQTVTKSKACIKGDCKDGYGTFVSKNKKYIGYFIDSEEHGRGTLVYKDGSKYIGHFIKGKINGQGIFTKKNGEKYEGQFVDGLYSGKGTLIYKDESKYTGEFVKGKFHGKME